MGGKRRRWFASASAALAGAVGLAMIAAGTAWLGTLLLLAAIVLLAWGARPVFTSEGMRWRTHNEGEISHGVIEVAGHVALEASEGPRFGAAIYVIPLAPLPQPLDLMLRCSSAPKDTVVSFREGSTTQKRLLMSSKVRVRGRNIRLSVQEPQLSSPAVLSVLVTAEEPIHVVSVRRKDAG